MKTFSQILFSLLLLTFIITGCEKENPTKITPPQTNNPFDSIVSDTINTDTPCNCPDTVGVPVCATDGKTYQSSCFATCAGATIINCSDTLKKDTTVTNPVDTAKNDTLNPACICPAVYAPVCGSDGKVYGNSCEASCAGVTVINCNDTLKNDTTNITPTDTSKTDTSCMCIEIFAPVCGSDGKFYENSCKAVCAGVSIIECKDTIKVDSSCILNTSTDVAKFADFITKDGTFHPQQVPFAPGLSGNANYYTSFLLANSGHSVNFYFSGQDIENGKLKVGTYQMSENRSESKSNINNLPAQTASLLYLNGTGKNYSIEGGTITVEECGKNRKIKFNQLKLLYKETQFDLSKGTIYTGVEKEEIVSGFVILYYSN